jgi:hypothetical protein
MSRCDDVAMYRCRDVSMSRCDDVAIFRKPCIDVTEFRNDLCIGHNVAMIRDTFVTLWCSPIHAEPTGFAVSQNYKCSFVSRVIFFDT